MTDREKQESLQRAIQKLIRDYFLSNAYGKEIRDYSRSTHDYD